MSIKKETRIADYEIIREGSLEIMRINALSYGSVPSVEDSSLIMMRTIDKLVEVPSISRIVFNQRKNYIYNEEQTGLLVEIANLYSFLTKQKRILGLSILSGIRNANVKHANLQYLVLNLLRSDPIGAYVEAIRLIREVKIELKKLTNEAEVESLHRYFAILEDFAIHLGRTKLIKLVKNKVAGHVIGDRSLYKEIFRAEVMPDFMHTRLMARVPLDGDDIDAYSVGENEIRIFKVPNDIKYLYHITPPEFRLSEDEQILINLARSVLTEHKPKEEEFLEPDRMRRTFSNIGADLLVELARSKSLEVSYERIKELAKILVRYTVGFGILEVLLQDPKVQDVVVNGPIGQNPLFIVHQDYDNCTTNIWPSQDDGESWASKLRLISGRPLDEANPVLDTELLVPGARARVSAMGRPLSPVGYSFAFRRHRDMPWTLPLYIHNRMISPLAAGLVSFLIDGARTMLIAGTRSSGKCVRGDTLIQLANGDIKKIKNIVRGDEEKIKDGYIYTNNKKNKILTLDGFKLKKMEADVFWKRYSPKTLIKLKTRSGKEIVTTPEHPYFSYENGLKHVRADMLSKGMYIATPRTISVETKKQRLYPKTSDKIIEYNGHYVIKGKTSSNSVTFPKFMTKELAEVLGYLYGDGVVNKTEVALHNSNKAIRERFKRLICMFKVPFREHKTRTTYVVQISSRLLSRVISKTFGVPLGRKSGKIKIPSQILKSNNNVLASFLRAYFDCDGFVPEDKRDLELVTKSKLMAEQLKTVLLRYGIVSFCKLKLVDGKKYYRTLIRGKFVGRYADHIGFFHPFKLSRLNKIRSRKWMDNTNVDVIPDGPLILKKLRKKLRITPKQIRGEKDYWAYEHDFYRATRDSFGKLVRFYENRYNQLKTLSPDIKKLKELINFNFESYLGNLERLHNLVGVSYRDVAKLVGFSDKYVKKILDDKSVSNLDNFRKMDLYEFYENQIEKSDSLNVCYADLSRNTNIPESSLKSYFYGGVTVPLERQELISNELKKIRFNLSNRLSSARKILDKLPKNLDLPDYFQIAMLLSRLRRELNIKNEELVSDNVCLMTVSNFFNGRCKTSLNVLRSMIKKIKDVYESTVIEEVGELLEEAKALADSDIFWDEISSVESVISEDKWVYDLTVEPTHSFIANGIFAHNTSFLGACLVELMRKYRIIAIEDTRELPVDVLRKFGYDIQPMKVRSALMVGGTEVGADEGIRTSLRFGDSSLIVGEIRSLEAKALFEAMRIGALANVVAGTIHGADPYSVYDRVVNDLEVPKTSFKATDIILVCNPVKSPDGLHRWKRVMQITEVRKQWTEDPLAEKGFVDLFKYDPRTDMLEPTDELINGESEVIKAIAGNVRSWAGNWDAVWDNIVLRAKIKETLVKYAQEAEMHELMESKFVVDANDQFHKFSDEIMEEVGELDSKRIFLLWDSWLKREIKKRRILV